MRFSRAVQIFFMVFVAWFFTPSTVQAQGHWEIGVHYGIWSLNLLRGPIERVLGDALEEQVTTAIEKDFPSKTPQRYTQDVHFDSSGNNFGLEIRYYPGGRSGVFSIGASIEKTTMEFQIDGEAREEFTDASWVDVTASGNVRITPLSFHLSLRWDIAPTGQIHPYITFGVGISPLTGTLKFTAEGASFDATTGRIAHYQTSDRGDLENIEEIPLQIFPIVQLNLGIKGEIVKNAFLLLDVGVWNGLLLRGNLAYRF